jgi:signal transduction histidine kinase
MGLHFSSLRTRILVLATVPLVGLLALTLWISHQTTTRAIESAAAGRLQDAASVLEEMVKSRHDALHAQARVTASDPRFFATFSVPDDERGAEFVRTMEYLSADFLQITDADFIEIYDAVGGPLLRVDRGAEPPEGWRIRVPGRRSLALAAERTVSADRFINDGAAVLVVDAPVFLGARQEAILRMGRRLDREFAADVRRLTGSELALGSTQGMVISTWSSAVPSLTSARATQALDRRDIAGESFLCTEFLLEGIEDNSGIVALLGRSTTHELAGLKRAERLMVAIGLAALLLTVIASISIAVGVTRPLHALMGFARLIREGDYTEPVPVQGRDEVALLARTLEESRTALQAHVSRLEDLDRRKGEFLALAGHEIRTPLTVITSFNDMLRDGMFGELPEEVTETTSVIGEQLSHLNELVTDIIDLTALDTAPEQAISIQAIPVAETLLRVIEDQRSAREGRDIDLVWSLPGSGVAIPGDERLIARAFRALLDNAVRFTPDGGHVEVLVLEKDGEARISVVDDGVGINPDELRWIYEKLYEGADIEHHSSGGLAFQAGGMGMGLSIARAVVDAHGGRLDVESQPGQGSTFTMTLETVAGAERGPGHAGSNQHSTEEIPC